VVAIFKVMPQLTVGEVANSIALLWADNFYCNSAVQVNSAIQVRLVLPELCVCIFLGCAGEAGVSDSLKTSTAESSHYHTRIVWNSGSSVHPASSAASLPVHTDSIVSHRDVAHSQSDVTRVQRETVTHVQQQETSDIMGESSRHSFGWNEYIKPQVHASASANRSENCPVNSFYTDCSTDAMKRSLRATEFADSMSSHPKNVTAYRKYEAVNKRPTSVNIFSQNVNSSADVEKCSVSSGQSYARDSVSACREPGVTADNELSIGRGRRRHCEAAGRHQLQRDTDAESMWQFAEKESFTTHQSFWHGDVREPETLRDAVSKREKLQHDVDKPETFRGGVSKPEKLHGWSSSGTSRHGNLTLIVM